MTIIYTDERVNRELMNLRLAYFLAGKNDNVVVEDLLDVYTLNSISSRRGTKNSVNYVITEGLFEGDAEHIIYLDDQDETSVVNKSVNFHKVNNFVKNLRMHYYNCKRLIEDVDNFEAQMKKSGGFALGF